MLVTVAEMKLYLGIPLSDVSHDAFLTTQINLISETIEAYLKRKIEATNYVEKIYEERARLYPKNIIVLDQYPVISVSDLDDVWINYATDPETETRKAITHYRLHKPSGKIIDFNCWSYFSHAGNYLEIKYRAGYETIPAPIKDAVFSLVQSRYNKQKVGIDLNFGSDVQRINIPGVVGIDFDYSLQGNERASAFGVILGNYLNVLDYYRSDRAILGEGSLKYVEIVP